MTDANRGGDQPLNIHDEQHANHQAKRASKTPPVKAAATPPLYPSAKRHRSTRATAYARGGRPRGRLGRAPQVLRRQPPQQRFISQRCEPGALA